MGKRFNLIPQRVTSRQLPASGFAEPVGSRYPGSASNLALTVLAVIRDYGLPSPAGGALLGLIWRSFPSVMDLMASGSTV